MNYNLKKSNPLYKNDKAAMQILYRMAILDKNENEVVVLETHNL